MSKQWNISNNLNEVYLDPRESPFYGFDFAGND